MEEVSQFLQQNFKLKNGKVVKKKFLAISFFASYLAKQDIKKEEYSEKLKWFFENFIDNPPKLPEYEKEFLRICSYYSKERREKYEKYLNSPEWKALRDIIFMRDGNICQECGGSASEVHHKHYKNLYNEREEDLISLCNTCHKKIHNIKED